MTEIVFCVIKLKRFSVSVSLRSWANHLIAQLPIYDCANNMPCAVCTTQLLNVLRKLLIKKMCIDVWD